MAKLKNFHGRYCEYEFENAFIQYLEDEGWSYMAGQQMRRSEKTEVIYEDDLTAYLDRVYGNALTVGDVQKIVNNVRNVYGETDFARLHKVYDWMSQGQSVQLESGESKLITLIDYNHPQENNIFRVVNQLVVEYTDNGDTHNRRPDVLLYVNGLPVCIIELKNPADESAQIVDAYEQICTRYWRDIPHLLRYCPLACICDGVKTLLGTVRTPYEHFYSWRRVNNEDKLSTGPFDELQAMIKGVFSPVRFLEIFRDYILFRDKEHDGDECEIVCRYPQFFATRLLRESIKRSVLEHNGKGGTYFGATGCGKTYTMVMLARQLGLRCSDVLGNPTVLIIVDRNDLQQQGWKVMNKCSEYMCMGDIKIVNSRRELRQELGANEGGGLYICTIQKFCDRKDDTIGLINDRHNIICFSDEAHRSQLEHSRRIKLVRDERDIQGLVESGWVDAGDDMKSIECKMRAIVSKPYVDVLHEALPNATFVGFTGTPIEATYSTFGTEVDRYAMDLAEADGVVVPIKYHPRIAKVLLDEKKVRLVEQYYIQCAHEGATEEDIAASKEAMSNMEVILDEPERLVRLCHDIHDHFTNALACDPQRPQKAMIACHNREIAFKLLKTFEKLYPEWLERRKSPEGMDVTEEELRELTEKPTIAMVASVGKNDPKEMYDYLGGTKNDERSKALDAAYKQRKSNFRVVIVADMWITGFDVPELTYLYNDKPLQRHQLIQTISRVNRKDEGKEFGMIVDYIGIRGQMLEAMKPYTTKGESLELSDDDVKQALAIFREYLAMLKQLFPDYDLTPFYHYDTDDKERYRLMAKAAEFVYSSTQVFEIEGKGGKTTKKVLFKDYYLQLVERMKAAHDVCQPSGVLDEEEDSLSQCFMSIAGMVRKMSGTSDIDTETMNRNVKRMVEEALRYSKVESILQEGEVEDIFDGKFAADLELVKAPATKLELLIKLLKKQITDYSKVNKMAAKKYQEMLQATIDQYHDRRTKLSLEEAGMTQELTTDDIISSATEQAFKILADMKADKESFRKVGLTFEEKAFYDILVKMRDEANFEFGEDKMVDGVVVNDKCKSLAKKIKELIDTKSMYADWLNNQNVRDQLKLDIKICLVKNGYPPTFTPTVFKQVMEQVENYKNK